MSPFVRLKNSLAHCCDVQPAMAIVLYLVSGLLVVGAIGATIGPSSLSSKVDKAIGMLGRLDGRTYRLILEYGYVYSRGEPSNAAFFPGYPVLASLLYDCGVPAPWALLAISWSTLLGALVLAQRYLRACLPDDPATANSALASCALYPLSCYMWFMYSESTFLFFVVLLLYLMQQSVSPLLVAIVCGALTGIRPPGLALVPVVLDYAYHYSSVPRARTIHVVGSTALCSWGLLAFAWHLHARFGDGLAFLNAQEMFQMSNVSLTDKLASFATLGPFRRVLATAPSFGSEGTWQWLLQNQVGDAISWILFGVLIIVGSWKRWLNRQEVLLSAGLFAFCTWFQADRSDMASQGRYMSVIFPAYITAGHLLAAVGWKTRLLLAIAAAALYVNYAANFAAGHAW